MEVIVLQLLLQMITSPHHQGTSHLQAKEVTKTPPPTKEVILKKDSNTTREKNHIAKIED